MNFLVFFFNILFHIQSYYFTGIIQKILNVCAAISSSLDPRIDPVGIVYVGASAGIRQEEDQQRHSFFFPPSFCCAYLHYYLEKQDLTRPIPPPLPSYKVFESSTLYVLLCKAADET